MTFEEFLVKKKIDSAAFKKNEPERWNEWHNEFGELHVNSFTMQKLHLINPIRRKYPLKEVPPAEATQSKPVAPKPKPVMPRPKPKFS